MSSQITKRCGDGRTRTDRDARAARIDGWKESPKQNKKKRKKKKKERKVKTREGEKEFNLVVVVVVVVVAVLFFLEN